MQNLGSISAVVSSKVWACTSVGACASSFIITALPYLQFIAVLISIAAGVKAWLESRKK
jgi:hypothetical protein